MSVAGRPRSGLASVFSPLDGHGRNEGRAEAVAQRLGDAICLGYIPHGTLLPPESELADRFGVAVVTVREALTALREDELVRTRRGRGGGSVVVAPTDAGSGLLRSRLRGRGLSDLRDLADHYATISGACARLATQRGDLDDLQRISHSAQLSPSVDVVGRRRAEGQFHLDIAASTQSARLTREELALQAEIGTLLWVVHERDEATIDAGQRHQDLAWAMKSGDADLARALAEAHIADLFERLRLLYRKVTR